MSLKKTAVLALSAVLILSGCGVSKTSGPEKLLESGDFEAASEEYINLLEKNEKDADLYSGLSAAYEGMNEYEAAVDTLCEGYGITKDKKLVSKMNDITEKLFETASERVDWQSVIYCCERILECDEDAKLYEMIALCYVRMGQYDKAVETVLSGAEETGDKNISKTVASELYTIGSKAYTDGETDEAKECFEYICEIDPDNNSASEMIDAINGTKKEESKKEEKPEEIEENSEPAEVTPKEVDTPEPVVQPSNTNTYTVQIGVYSGLENAENKVAAAKSAGFSASYFVSGGMYHVTIGSYSSESEANAVAAKAQAAGFSAVII